MKSIQVALTFLAGIAVVSPGLQGQSIPKPSSYSGVSQPPPDDTITSDAAPTASPALATRTAQAAPVATSTPAVTSAAAAPAPSIPAQPPAASSLPNPSCDPEDRMIGEPNPCVTQSFDATQPQLAPRPPSIDSDTDMVASATTRPGELPEATIIRLTLDQEISSGESQVGADFSGRVSADIMSSGRVVIPQGSQVLGKIVEVTEGHRFGSPATIRLRPDVVVLPDGSRYVLRALVIQTNTRSRIDQEGTLRPASRVKTNVIEEAAGIGTGAVVGAVVGGGPGALIGGAIGAGVMTTHIIVQHPATVKIPKDSTLTLSLTQPMLISPEIATNTPGGSN